MLDGLYLSEFQSSVVTVAVVGAAGLILPYVIDSSNRLHRTVLLAIAFLLAARYIWWRGTETLAPWGLTADMMASWSLFALEALALVGSLSAYLILSRVRHRSAEVDAHLGWWRDGPCPKVAILIATYNEDLEVLERTIVGAKSLRHPRKEVLVLDDGKRDWLRDYCGTHGVRYVRRPDNRDAKAGNINHALDLLEKDAVPPDFVAVLDADFVPHRGFISRTLSLFHDPRVGLVQTPQHFFNADPIQHNLGLSQSYPDEQRFFFDQMQPSRDGWDMAFCCGTSSVMRWAAVRAIGGLPTESVTEDFLLTLALRNAGWSTVYLNEPLTEGLAPEGLKEYVTQRSRWCLGMMQIVRSSLGPFHKSSLRLRDRWSVVDSLFYWLTTFPFRIATVVYPLFYWYLDVTVVDARLADVITYFGCFFVWSLIVLNLLSQGMVVPILNDVSQLIGAISISRAAFVGLLKPRGHPFRVTAKGGDRSRIVIQWRLMSPFAVLLVLTFLGLFMGIFSDRFAFNAAGDGKWVVLFWTIYNLVLLTVTVVACIELPRHETHVADAPERAVFVAGGRPRRLWITSLTADTVRVRGHRYLMGDRGMIRIRGVGDVEAYVIAETDDGARLHLITNEDQREALHLKFYADNETAPGVARVRTAALVEDLAHRFSFTSTQT